MARRRSGGPRQYPRTARVNELVREIVADEVERLDDSRLELVAVTSVEIEADLRHGVVYFDTLEGEDADEPVLEAFAEHRVRLQAAIGRQARLRRTPELAFEPDQAVRSGARIEAILRDIGPPVDDAAADDLDVAEAATEPGGLPPDEGAAPGGRDGNGGGDGDPALQDAPVDGDAAGGPGPASG